MDDPGAAPLPGGAVRRLPVLFWGRPTPTTACLTPPSSAASTTSACLYSDALAEADGCDEQAYFDRLRERVNAQTGVPVLMFIGDRVATLETLDISVRSAIAARVVESFRMDVLQADSEKRRQALQTDAGRADPGGGAGRRRRDRAGRRRAVQCAGQRRAGRPDDHGSMSTTCCSSSSTWPCSRMKTSTRRDPALYHRQHLRRRRAARRAGISEPLRQRVRGLPGPSCAAATWAAC